MYGFKDVLRGYGYEVMKRDEFRCQYCGLDGLASFDAWLSLVRQYLLPKGDPDRENPEFIVTVCHNCAVTDTRHFERSASQAITYSGKTRAELIEQRRPFVEAARRPYKDFWDTYVTPTSTGKREG
jgi:hypothetical protein